MKIEWLFAEHSRNSALLKLRFSTVVFLLDTNSTPTIVEFELASIPDLLSDFDSYYTDLYRTLYWL
jgi:hypothetical protein